MEKMIQERWRELLDEYFGNESALVRRLEQIRDEIEDVSKRLKAIEDSIDSK